MGDEFFLIEAGSAEAYKLINGQETRVKSMGPGDYFGGKSSPDHYVHQADARTRTPQSPS